MLKMYIFLQSGRSTLQTLVFPAVLHHSIQLCSSQLSSSSLSDSLS